MSKKTLQRFAVITLILILAVVPALAFFASDNGSEYAYEIPRMLGMEGLGEHETAQLDGPPSTDVSAPIFETHGKAVSLDKDIRDLPQIGPKDKKPAREMGTPPNAGPNGNGIDAVTQGVVASSAPAPAPDKTFAGLDFINWGAGWPPDTDGDVGPTYYIQAVNTSIGVFKKSDGTRVSAFTFDNFFLANNEDPNDACATLNYGDPEVLYDQVSGRWIITDFAFAGTGGTPPYYECIAVSKTADPVGGGWWLYTVVADSQSLNDYPKLGIWNDGIYMSANMFKRGRSYAGAKVWALNRDDLINGATLRTVAFQLGNTYFSLLPANARADELHMPPAGTPEYFMSDYGSNTSMKLWQFHVDWNTPSASTLTGPTSFAVSSFTRPSSSVPQYGTSQTLDTLGDRLMNWLQYSNVGGTEALWVSRTVVAGSSMGVRWMEVRGMNGTPSVYQQGTYAPDSNYRWMPSLAVNSNGTMAIGYSVSSSSMYPAIRYAGRLASDPLNVLGQTETSFIEGTSAQASYNRWGDYASMSVDPDGCTFWFTTEYYDAATNAIVDKYTGNHWQTRIGSFQLPDCGGGPVDAAPVVSITNPSNGSSFNSGESISFSGSAIDDLDGDVSSSLVWTSDLDGQIGTGASFSAVLSDGTHTITASATDSSGHTGYASVAIMVGGGGTGSGDLVVSVSTDKSSYSNHETAYITVNVTDGSAPVAGASVTVRITTPKGTVYSGTSSTNSSGQVTFNFNVNTKKDGSGTYSVEATATASGYNSGSDTTSFTAQ